LQLANTAAATETLGSAKVCKSERTYHGEEDEALQAPLIATHRNTELIDRCNTKTNYALVSLSVVSLTLSPFSRLLSLSLSPFLSSNLPKKKTKRRVGKEKKEKKKRETVWTERVATRLSENALVLQQQRSCTRPPNRTATTTFSNEQTTKQARHETKTKEKKKGETDFATNGRFRGGGGDLNGPDLRT
jgi:hypothetical protein